MDYPLSASDSHVPVTTRLREDCRQELQLAEAARANLLLVGTDIVPVLLEMLGLHLLNDRILSWHPGESLALPSTRHPVTFLIHDVDQLTPPQQFEILSWLEQSPGRIRVVSTTEQPLWPRVAGGTFNEALYYRLNTVYVEVGASDDLRAML